MLKNIDIFVCPKCKGNLKTTVREIECQKCHSKYEIKNGIPLFYYEEQENLPQKAVTSKMKAFYEKTPFPNYENTDDVPGLIQKAQRSIFAYLLNQLIPYNIRVLEVGCGTGQLANYLGIAHRSAFGADMCFNSLKLAQQFRDRNEIERTGFYQMNLFNPIFKEESFSFVICNGVLHHTGDPYGGFRSIAKLVKKDGYVIVGLYNKYGRITTDIRRLLFSFFGDRIKALDPRIRKNDINEIRKLTWFLDQYKNPHESKHTIDEVLGWFDQTGFEFVNSIPKISIFNKFNGKDEDLFEINSSGNLFERIMCQLILMLSGGGEEGGFFVMIGKRIK